MKKYPLLILLALFFQLGFGQVKTVPATSLKLTPIPSTKATIIRKDTKTLQLQVTQLNDSVTILKKQMDVLMTSLKDKSDSIGEMTEADQLRMQQAMDRMNSLMQMISNLMKKMHDTQMAIINNLKA